MKYSKLLELNDQELLELYNKTSNIGLKTIIYYQLYQQLDNESLDYNRQNPDLYLQEIEPFLSATNFKILIPATIENLLSMLKLNTSGGSFNEYYINELFETPSIKTYPSNQQLLLVESLINKNKLKTSTNFLYNKINDNLLLAKIEDHKIKYSFGLKTLDDQLLEKLGAEFHDSLELGWLQNNGDREDFRKALTAFLSKLDNQNIIALIREDNIKALNLTKEFNFKEIKRIQSPYSHNILVILKP